MINISKEDLISLLTEIESSILDSQTKHSIAKTIGALKSDKLNQTQMNELASGLNKFRAKDYDEDTKVGSVLKVRMG